MQVARALAFDCRVLVLDEPTTSLTSAEADHLFLVLDRLRDRGVTILYVSHRIPEVFRLCDRMTVLRDGAYVETFVHSRGSSSSPQRHRTASSARWSDVISRRAKSGAVTAAPRYCGCVA